MTRYLVRYVVAVAVVVAGCFAIDHEIVRAVVVVLGLAEAFGTGLRIGDLASRREVTASVRRLRAEIDQYAAVDLTIERAA